MSSERWERTKEILEQALRLAAEKSNYRHRLLCEHAKRPSCRRSACKRDNLPPRHCSCAQVVRGQSVGDLRHRSKRPHVGSGAKADIKSGGEQFAVCLQQPTLR